MCIHSMQGFSLFKVVLLCDVTSNTMLFLLKSKGTAIYYIFFLKPKKKKLWSQEGLRSLSKSHIFKTAAPKFLFLKSELILCNIFPPFSFWCTSFQWSLLGGMGQMHSSWFFFFKGARPQQCPHPVILFIHPVAVLQSEGPLSRRWNERTIHSSSDCPHRQKATPGLSVHVWALLSVCCSVAQRRQLVYEKQIINNKSHLDASREAAGPCDNTVLLMLYKRRERLILNLVNKKCTKVKARWI